MLTVDEGMHGGEYIDRRGRRWCNLVNLKWDADAAVMRTTKIGWCRMRGLTKYDPPVSESQMRLLVERDQHQCGYSFAAECDDHPVPVVCRRLGGTDWIISGELGGYSTLAEAMDAARALAVVS